MSTFSRPDSLKSSVMRGFFSCSALLLAALAFLSGGCSNSNERANKLFVEAVSTFKGVKEAETSDEAEQLAAWKKTSDLLDRIIKDFSGTDIAVQLVQEKKIIEGLTLTEFRQLPDRLKEKWCFEQLKVVGLAASAWADDHNDTLPQNFAELLQAVTGEGTSPTNHESLADLVCPKSKQYGVGAGSGQRTFQPDEIERIGYKIVRFGLKSSGLTDTRVWLRCERCRHELRVNVSVHKP